MPWAGPSGCLHRVAVRVVRDRALRRRKRRFMKLRFLEPLDSMGQPRDMTLPPYPRLGNNGPRCRSNRLRLRPSAPSVLPPETLVAGFGPAGDISCQGEDLKVSHYTLFNAPIVSSCLRWCAIVMIRAIGWRVEGVPPSAPKYVMIAAPHTSNWDGLLMVMVAFVLRIRLFWLLKHSLYRFPFRTLLRLFGAIPVDRNSPAAVVDQAVSAFAVNERFVLALAPEGTRKRRVRWKTGFYRIAVAAQVPLVLGFLDYRRRIGGVASTLKPSGSLDADLAELAAFYDQIGPLRPAMYTSPLPSTGAVFPRRAQLNPEK